MSESVVLLVDLRIRDRSEKHLKSILPAFSGFNRETEISSIEGRIRRERPRLLVFLFDHPTDEGLDALTRVKHAFPSIPILMLTEHHSEELAIWAFQTGVRDYMYSPFSEKNLEESVNLFSSLRRTEERARYTPRIERPNPGTPVSSTDERKGKRTAPALDFIDAHLQGKITLNQVAEYCSMSGFAFSHVFKNENRVTFQEYTSRCRIRKAQELLTDTDAPVTEVALSVGFSDLSHFSRTFRRYVGVSASAYRLHCSSQYPKISCDGNQGNGIKSMLSTLMT